MPNRKKRTGEGDAERPMLKQEAVAVEVRIPGEGGNKAKCLWTNMDPLTIGMLLVILILVSVVAYHEFNIETVGEKMEKQLKYVVKARKLNTDKLSQILDRVEEPKIHGLPVDRAVKVSQACDKAHCAVPCIRGRSQGFGNFLESALDIAEPIVSKIPILPKVVTAVIGPVASLVKKITGHPYSAVSNGYCARLLDYGSGPDMGGALQTGSSGKKALGYQHAGNGLSYNGRRKREVNQEDVLDEDTETTDSVMQGEGYAKRLADMYGVEASGGDEEEALDNVLLAIFSKLEL